MLEAVVLILIGVWFISKGLKKGTDEWSKRK